MTTSERTDRLEQRVARRNADKRRGPLLSQNLILDTVCVGDLAIVMIAGLLSHRIRFGEFSTPPEDFMLLIGGFLAAAGMFHALGAYRFSVFVRPFKQLRSGMLAWTLTLLVVVTALFAFKSADDYSRLWIGYWFLVGAGMLATWRLAVEMVIRRARVAGALAERLAIVAPAGVTDFAPLMDRIRKDPSIRLVRTAEIPLTGGTDERARATVDLLRLQSVQSDIDRILVIPDPQTPRPDPAIMDTLRLFPVDVDVVINGYCEDVCGRPVRSMAGIPVVNMMRRPLTDLQIAVKRAEDLVLGSLLLVIAAPVLAIVALAIRLDSRGPIFFRQLRHGFNQKPFRVWKFRSMYHASDKRPRVVHQATRDDPRVTRVGRFLRRTSLDELPQIFNVLKGDMSLVGPRPHAIEHNDHFRSLVKHYLARHRVKPGITGWAQVNGLRGETETVEKMNERVEFDLFYVDNWSVLFDLKVGLMTPLVAIHKNAY